MSQYILPALFPKRPDNESHDILSSLVTEKGDFFWYSYNVVVHVRPFLVGYSVHFPLGACLFYMMYGWDLYDLFSDDWLYFLPFVSSPPSFQHQHVFIDVFQCHYYPRTPAILTVHVMNVLASALLSGICRFTCLILSVCWQEYPPAHFPSTLISRNPHFNSIL